MNYTEARAAHTQGKNVTCGMGVRFAGAKWNTRLDLAPELDADWIELANWYAIRSQLRVKDVTWSQCAFTSASGAACFVGVHVPELYCSRHQEEALKLKSKPVNGVCAASRCTSPVTTPETLCAKHLAGDAPAKAPKASESLELVRAELEPVKNEQLEVLQAVAALELDTVYTMTLDVQPEELTGLQAVTKLRDHARAKAKDLEGKRKAITGPMDAAKKGVMDLFRPAIDTCEAVQRACRDRLEEHARALREVQMAALAAAGAGEDAAPMLAVAADMQAMPEGTKVHQVLDYEVLDFAALPDQFKQVDDRAIRAYLSMSAGLQDIPGVRISKGIKVTA